MTQQNWESQLLGPEGLKAFIALSCDGGEVFYSLTVVDESDCEVFQQDFSALKLAIGAMNKRYGHWNWAQDPSQQGGCGTCSAH